MPDRILTESETAILDIIQRGYGSQNGADQVFFTEKDEAVIFVRAGEGTSRIMANLSFLAGLRAQGTSDDELKRDWLRLDT